MKQSKKDIIVNILERLNFVNWDRYFGEGENLSFFGWIGREKDNYKDFVLVEFFGEKIVYYGTSSKEYSKKVANILNQTHSDCKRVDHFCNVPNVIKLSSQNK